MLSVAALDMLLTIVSDENGMKEIKIPLDSLIRKSPSQYRPINYFAESIELKRIRTINVVLFQMDLLKQLKSLRKNPFWICTLKKKPWR